MTPVSENAVQAALDALPKDLYDEYYSRQHILALMRLVRKTDIELQPVPTATDKMKARYGIDAILAEGENGLPIIIPYVDGQADRAGIRLGDELVSINGAMAEGLSLEGATDKLQGDLGDRLHLVVRRGGRDMLIVVTTNYGLPNFNISEVDIGIMLIRANNFFTEAPGVLRAKLQQVADMNPRGLIIDLRRNPGGTIPAIQEFLGAFVAKERPVMTIMPRWDQQTCTMKNDASPVFSVNIPMFILVDRGTFAGARVAASVLQKERSAFLFGEDSKPDRSTYDVVRTFGKYSIRFPIADFPSNPLSVRKKASSSDPHEQLIEAIAHLQSRENIPSLFEVLDKEMSSTKPATLSPAKKMSAAERKAKRMQKRTTRRRK